MDIVITIQGGTMKNIATEYYLEGTEGMLNDFSSRDKATILKVASELKINRLRKINADTFSSRKISLDCSYAKAARGASEALEFYFNNIPKGFKRPDNMYEMANKEGVVLRFNRRHIPVYKDMDGYIMFKGFFIKEVNGKTHVGTKAHRIVAMAFIPNPKKLATVNHKNGVKDNNNITNLEWMSQQDNVKHAWENGFNDGFYGERNRFAKLKQKDVSYLRETYGILLEDYIRSMALDFKTTADVISGILMGMDKQLPRFRVDRRVKKNGVYRIIKNVWCCREDRRGSDAYIRGGWRKIRSKFYKDNIRKFSIDIRTIYSVCQNKSWKHH